MRILVGIDGSEPALRALRFAVTLQGKLSESGSIGIVSVHDDSALRGASHVLGQAAIDDYLNERLDADLTPALALLRSTEIAFETIRRTGRPEREITALADEAAFDMIVMGCKGRSGLADLLIGSIAQRVSAMASQPVVLIK